MQTDTRQFWLGWTLVTLVGYVVGILVVLPITVTLAYDTQQPLLIGLISGAVLGATVGLAQWLLLRRRTSVTISWVSASIIGGMIGMALGTSLGESIAAPVATSRDAMRENVASLIPWHVVWQTGLMGAFFGGGMGLAQSWVLRQFAPSAGWWIVANGVAWMVGLGVGAAIAGMVTTLGALLVTGLLAAAITAYGMERWQLRMRGEPTPW